MPTDHPRVSFTDVFVLENARFGEIGRGLSLVQCFVHGSRIRQAASSSLGAADNNFKNIESCSFIPIGTPVLYKSRMFPCTMRLQRDVLGCFPDAESDKLTKECKTFAIDYFNVDLAEVL